MNVLAGLVAEKLGLELAVAKEVLDGEIDRDSLPSGSSSVGVRLGVLGVVVPVILFRGSKRYVDKAGLTLGGKGETLVMMASLLGKMYCSCESSGETA